jgi:hypothetical protein
MRRVSPGLWIGAALLAVFVLLALLGAALAPYPAAGSATRASRARWRRRAPSRGAR